MKTFDIITHSEYEFLLGKLDYHTFEENDLNQFIMIEVISGTKRYITIDNQTGELFVEEFDSLDKALEYLLG